MGCDNGNAQQKANQIKKNRPKTVQKRVQKNSNQALIAPDFTLADLDGNWVSLSELKGKVVLLNFWGTWCGPCRREIPAFIKLTEKYKKDGLAIVVLTLTSVRPEYILSFSDNWAINYTLLTAIAVNETQVFSSNYV